MSAAASEPLTGGQFSSLMAPFAPFELRPVLAIAVSGGRDSLALALLAHDWAGALDGRIVGLIVDHGLRRESADEAAKTRDLLVRHGIAAEVLRWRGAKPASGLQEAAREARYRLLLAACRRRGILHLLVAHHADDQAETVVMRAARGSGPDGLAGMASLVEHREARAAASVVDPSGTIDRYPRGAGRGVDRRSVESRQPLRAGASQEGGDYRAHQRGTCQVADSRRPAPGDSGRGSPGIRPGRGCRHRPCRLCPAWPRAWATPAQPGHSGDGQPGPSAAARAARASGGTAFARRWPWQVGKKPGFHPI